MSARHVELNGMGEADSPPLCNIVSADGEVLWQSCTVSDAHRLIAQQQGDALEATRWAPPLTIRMHPPAPQTDDDAGEDVPRAPLPLVTVTAPFRYCGGNLGLCDGGEPWIYFSDGTGQRYLTHDVQWLLQNHELFLEGRDQLQLLACAAKHFELPIDALMELPYRSDSEEPWALATRIERAMMRAGFTSRSALARASGVSPHVVRRIAMGAYCDEITGAIRAVADSLRVNAAWLAFGEVASDSATLGYFATVQ